jgi:hypothetical protein
VYASILVAPSKQFDPITVIYVLTVGPLGALPVNASSILLEVKSYLEGHDEELLEQFVGGISARVESEDAL